MINDPHVHAPEGLVGCEVLIVEDNSASLTLLSEIVESAGYSVRQAQDGQMALLSVKSRTPDLILLDVRMPGMDGFEVCRQLKANPKTDSIPVIFLSALKDSDAKLEGLKLGAVDYIAKPYDPDDVLLRVRTHLELRNLQQHLGEMCDLRTLQLKEEMHKHRNTAQELFESRQQLRELTAHLEQVQEQQRARIAREIHDELGQALTVLRIDLTRLNERLGEPREVLQQNLENALSVLDQASETARTISENLRPGMLDLLGLEAALEHHVKRFTETTGIPCHLSIDSPVELNPGDRVATTIFRIVQESLTNIARHAKAGQAVVRLANLGQELVVIVEDDGCGFESTKNLGRSHFGLLGISERAQSLGGSISVESKPGKGTRIEASLPLKEMEEGTSD